MLGLLATEIGISNMLEIITIGIRMQAHRGIGIIKIEKEATRNLQQWRA